MRSPHNNMPTREINQHPLSKVMVLLPAVLTVWWSTILILSSGCIAADVVSADNIGSIDEQSVAKQTSDSIPDANVNEGDNTDASSNSDDKLSKQPQKRVTLFGLEDMLNLERSGIVGLGHAHGRPSSADNPRLNYNKLHAQDMIEDSFFDPFSPDPSCEDNADECWHPPDSTVEEGMVEVCDGSTKPAGLETLAWGYGGADPDDGVEEGKEGEKEDQERECIDLDEGEESEGQKPCPTPKTDDKCDASKKKTKFVDKHWGSDIDILRMRDRLRGRRGKYWDAYEQENAGNGTDTNTTQSSNSKQQQTRPPVFLMPGLASTRLVSWKHKPCPQNKLLSDIKMLDYVWLNMNLLVQMATINAGCWNECMTLGKYQSDYDGADVDEMEDEEQPFHGCKLRPDEGLDAISSLAPGSLSSNLFVGGTNTVYAWLIQWLADNLGYDVTSIVALPYDWRLSPDKMEERDGFLTLTRSKIEAAVKSNGRPGIMVAHSMGNSVFRYFVEWLRVQMREEAYERYVEQAKHTAAANRAEGGSSAGGRGPFWRGRALYRGLIHPAAQSIIEGEVDENNAPKDDVLDQLTMMYGVPTTKDEGQTAKADEKQSRKYPKLYELAKAEGDTEWIDWLGKHIWTYVGLSAPLLGAPGPLRSVLSGENMGLPFTEEEARVLECSFGSTSTVNPISSKMGFCDGEDKETGKMGRRRAKALKKQNSNLACLEELVSGIESSKGNNTNPWKDFPALRLLLKDRVDFDSIFPTIKVEREYCNETDCNQTTIDFGPSEIMNGHIFDEFSQIWRERNDPLGVKLDQLRHAWWNTNVPNMLESTPERPHIKHVILAYGVDVATEVGYVYRKTEELSNSTRDAKAHEFDEMPSMSEVIWEERHGRLVSESKIVEPSSFTEKVLFKKKETRRPLKTAKNETPSWLHHSGDGTIPYISLMWAHTWLLHATRAMRSSNITAPMRVGERISNPKNALDSIKVSHRPRGGNEWVDGYGADPRSEEDSDSSSNDDDTGTSHPHGTKYKPKMVRFMSSGKSRSTGMEYTTTVIEARGVEHKETTRNYDILAAAFTDVLKNLHDDYGLI